MEIITNQETKIDALRESFTESLCCIDRLEKEKDEPETKYNLNLSEWENARELIQKNFDSMK